MATNVHKQMAGLSIPKAFPDTDKFSINSDALLVVFELSGEIPWLKGTYRAMYFSVNTKLKIEFIFFCGVHNLQKLLMLCGMTCTKNYCFQQN